MQECHNGEHAITCVEVRACEDDHDQPDREDHGRDGPDETRSIRLEPRRGTGGERKGTAERDERTAHEAIDEHLINAHAGLLGADPRDKLRSLRGREGIHDDSELVGRQRAFLCNDDCEEKNLVTH